MREVDVLVSFRASCGNITLGVECKFWSKKVNGDVVDVVVAKKEDLDIDRFAIITTIGYESGAKEYAAYKGVDIFVVRPTVDADFIDTGKIVKVLLSIRGARPIKIKIEAQIKGSLSEREAANQFLQERISRADIEPDGELDKDLDLHYYTVCTDPVTSKQQCNQGGRYGSLQEIVYDAWEEEYQKWHKGGDPTLSVTLDTAGLGIFLEQYKCVAFIKEITFEIEYSESRTHFEIDRAQHFPFVLENIIKRSTQLIRDEKNPDLGYRLFDAIDKIPSDSIGRDGVHITMYVRKPISANGPAKEDTETYVLALLSPKTLGWKLYQPALSRA
ncbi:hypothetical protein D3C80_1141580 [compost metagenome]